jgi:hypothetical protein
MAHQFHWQLSVALAMMMCGACSGDDAASASASWSSSANYPLADSEAAALVQLNGWEPRPRNEIFNNTIPTGTQLRNVQNLSYMTADGNYMLHLADGRYTGTTDEILQWGAYKWGFDPNLARANAAVESSWNQDEIGDIGNGVSLGILQIKSLYLLGTCPQSPDFPASVDASSAASIRSYLASQPDCISYNSTAFGVDYKYAYQRACMNKDITYLNQYPPITGHATYDGATGEDLFWGCVGVWYSGYWWDSSAAKYVQTVQSALRTKPWLSY